MGVLQVRGDGDLSLEAFRADTRRQFRRQNLHHHSATESNFLGEKNARHSAAAELFLDAVADAKSCLDARMEVGHACSWSEFHDLTNHARP